MEEIRADGVNDACNHAAQWTLSRITRAIEERGHALLAFPGGNSIKPFARALARSFHSTPGLPLNRITIFLDDERVLPAGHEQRNDQLIASLLSEAGAAVEHGAYRPPARRTQDAILVCRPPLDFQVNHSVDIDRDLASDAAREYTEQLRHAGETIDLVVLGCGEDGHIASLFPNHELLAREDTGYAVITDSPKPPPTRITLLPESIARARAAVLLVFGNGKRQALRRYLSRNEEPTGLPAQLADAVEDRLVLTDQVDIAQVGRLDPDD